MPGACGAVSGAIHARPLDDLVAEAVDFHGHLCPGVVLGVRMALAGCRELGLDDPRGARKSLVIFVEIDRCATDAIQALTGGSIGKRTLKHVDLGRMAATFADVPGGRAVRVVALDEARDRAVALVPGESDRRRAQAVAYLTMPEASLLAIEPVRIRPGWLDRRRVRVACASCGEGVCYGREVEVAGRALCRACAGETYYDVAGTGRV